MQSKESIDINISGENETKSELLEFKQYRIGYFIAKNLSGKSDNEDSLFIYGNKDNLIFGVSDGAGGHPKGREASEIASKKIIELFKKNKNHNFIEYIEDINASVRDLKVGAHCTFITSIISDSFFRNFNVGDSEVIVWNSNGKSIYSNIPQSEVGYLIQSGSIEQSKSLDAPNRHFVSNLIGDEAIRIESTSKIELKKGNTILIGSDGIFDNLSHDELNDICTQGAFEKSYEKLVQLCTERSEDKWRKDDDISFIICRKNQSE